MCTIVVMHRCNPSYPLIVAANRDEIYARDARPPRPRVEDARVVAGVDCEHGGTWMGVHQSGFFVGLTNQRTWTFRRPSPRSRGAVAVAALRAGSRAAVTEMLRSLDPSEYNSFNLVWGDATGVEVAYARRDRPDIAIEALPPGLHVLANDRIGSPHFPKAERARDLALDAVSRPWPELVPALRGLLADHSLPPLDRVPAPPAGVPIEHALVRDLQALCIHTPFYGTRSSTIIAIDEERIAHYLFADGPPCTTAHVPIPCDL